MTSLSAVDAFPCPQIILSMCACRSTTMNQDGGGVIAQLRTTPEPLYFFHESLDACVRTKKMLEQTARPILFIAMIHRLSDPVRIEEQSCAWVQLDRLFRIRRCDQP